MKGGVIHLEILTERERDVCLVYCFFFPTQKIIIFYELY